MTGIVDFLGQAPVTVVIGLIALAVLALGLITMVVFASTDTPSRRLRLIIREFRRVGGGGPT